ncbi:hypothetical protein EB118_20720 [bacterium]|nr:hypothetical protein [bacterium]NDG32483.1 hypothetical protein [bacterium]
MNIVDGDDTKQILIEDSTHYFFFGVGARMVVQVEFFLELGALVAGVFASGLVDALATADVFVFELFEADQVGESV